MTTATFAQARTAPAYASRLRRLASSGLALADALCTAVTPAFVRDAPGLLVLAMHSLCEKRSELQGALVVPEQNVCVDDLRALVEATLGAGYRIVSPAEVDEGLMPQGRYALLTFDDGYYNNILALDVLEEFGVPATFFISSRHVLEAKGFWWDAVHRELTAAGADRLSRNAELRRLKLLPVPEMERLLRSTFGSDVLAPRGDRDRPFRPAELASFSLNRWVHIGNHTVDHTILTRCSPSEVQAQIEGCQSDLQSITGRRPLAIAYPNGNHSELVVQAARAAGLRVGFTVRPVKNHVGRPGTHLPMRLGRFYFHGRMPAERELRTCSCGYVPSRMLRALIDAS